MSLASTIEEAGSPFRKGGEDVTRASKHRKESMTTKTSKTNEKSMSLGLKSHCAGLLLRKEKGKCDAAKHGAEFPSIVNHSPEQQVNQKWP